MNEIRKAFEEWARGSTGPWSESESAWIGWQASWQASRSKALEGAAQELIAMAIPGAQGEGQGQTMSDAACGNCRFYKIVTMPDSGDVPESEGACRRYPHVYIAPLPEHIVEGAWWRGVKDFHEESPVFWAQPRVYGSSWCGEYVHKGW